MNHYRLTVAKVGNGSVASNPPGIDCGNTCSEDYLYGTVVTLTPIANTGYSFSGWTGACTGNGVCQVTMDAAKAVTATFGLNLTVGREGDGSVTSNPPGIDCGNNCTANYLYGTVVNLTATANAGSRFNGWTGACTGNGVCQVTMDAAKAVTASFKYRLPKTNWVATAFSSPTICCQNDTAPKAIDGDGWTRWSSGVAQAPANQWFQIDMATEQIFTQIVMDAGLSSEDYPREYEVYVSTDGITWSVPITHGIGSPLTTIDFVVQTPRYLRILQTGTATNWWSIHELNVSSTTASICLSLCVDRGPHGSWLTKETSQVAGIACGCLRHAHRSNFAYHCSRWADTAKLPPKPGYLAVDLLPRKG